MTLIDTAKIGRQGGNARAANLSGKELSKSASNAAQARWAAYYKANPDKLQAKLEREKKKKAGKKKAGKKKAGPK